MHIPQIANIKRNSLDDGPGIRSTVFFKGCPLSCVWCHNPECIKAKPELLYRAELCIGCRDCTRACPSGAIGPDGPAALNRTVCELSRVCVDECPAGALELVGENGDIDAMLEVLLRDKVFFDSSGGGVTLSGGEATLFCEFAGALAGQLQTKGIHVLLETCGHFDWQQFDTTLRQHLNLIYVDLKLIDASAHKKFCGKDNKTILDNLDRLIGGGAEVLVRIPLVPGITDTSDNLSGTAAFLRERGVNRVALLPYNPLWKTKSEGLGRDIRYDHDSWHSEDQLEEARAFFEGFEMD